MSIENPALAMAAANCGLAASDCEDAATNIDLACMVDPPDEAALCDAIDRLKDIRENLKDIIEGLESIKEGL